MDKIVFSVLCVLAGAERCSLFALWGTEITPLQKGPRLSKHTFIETFPLKGLFVFSPGFVQGDLKTIISSKWQRGIFLILFALMDAIKITVGFGRAEIIFEK